VSTIAERLDEVRRLKNRQISRLLGRIEELEKKLLGKSFMVAEAALRIAELEADWRQERLRVTELEALLQRVAQAEIVSGDMKIAIDAALEGQP
jgi:hypothetical protein